MTLIANKLCGNCSLQLAIFYIHITIECQIFIFTFIQIRLFSLLLFIFSSSFIVKNTHCFELSFYRYCQTLYWLCNNVSSGQVQVKKNSMGQNAFDNQVTRGGNLKLYCQILLSVPVLNIMKLAHTLAFYFCYVEFNNTHPFVHLPRGLFPFSYSDQNIIEISGTSRVCYMTQPCYPPWFFI